MKDNPLNMINIPEELDKALDQVMTPEFIMMSALRDITDLSEKMLKMRNDLINSLEDESQEIDRKALLNKLEKDTLGMEEMIIGKTRDLVNAMMEDMGDEMEEAEKNMTDIIHKQLSGAA